MNSTLKKITSKAKLLYKSGKYAKWTDAIKAASKGISTGVKKIKKRIGALPIGFSGKIWGVGFKVINQFDIYDEVSAIVEDTTTGSRIISFDGKKSTKDLTDAFVSYITKQTGQYDEKSVKELKSRLLKFCTNLNKEVKDYNSGKKATIKKLPIKIEAPKIKKIPVVKKSIVKKKHTHYGKVKAHERRVNGVTKSPGRYLHKDTKSHNVRISVVSGIGDIGEHFTRINNDVNGNPRYVIHFFDVLNSEERLSIPFSKLYQYAIKKAKKIGGKKYDNKSYGGGIVFQSYNIENTFKKIEELKNTNPKIKF
jgi:hypothetical protein